VDLRRFSSGARTSSAPATSSASRSGVRRPTHHQGRSWAQVAAFVGQRKLSYTHVLVDEREVDYAKLLETARA
jgi:hypothetical protein